MGRVTAVVLLGLVSLAGEARAQPEGVPPPPTTTPTATPTTTPTPEPVAATEDDEPEGEPEARDEPERDGEKKAKQKTKQKAKKPRVRISGYLQVFYKHRFEANDDGEREPDLFRVGRARVKVDAKVVKNVSLTVEIDPRSPAIGGVMRDGYLQIKNVIPRHRIRIGQQKTPFGYENDESSASLYTVTRTELSEGPARGVTLRDIGIGIRGEWPINDQLTFEDAVAVVNGAGMNVQADDTHRKNVWGRLGLRLDHPAIGIARLGVSGANGDQIEPGDPTVTPPELAFKFKFTRIGVDLEVDHEWVFVAAEYAMSADTVEGEETEDSMGWYVLVAGKTPWHVGPVFRYDTFDLEEFSRITAGVYWGEPAAKLRAMINFERFEDEAGLHDHRLHLWTQARF